MDKRIKLIVGHCGSGKTEFSLTYALRSAGNGNKVVLADLDIVNPYFRSREKKEMLRQAGVLVIDSSIADGRHADIPALSPQILTAFTDPQYESIADVGGDPAGARILSRFQNVIPTIGYEMWMVVNANRPETQTADNVIRYMHMMESSSRLKISAIINNTHLVRETKIEDILAGNTLCRKVKEKTGIPIRFTCVYKLLTESL